MECGGCGARFRLALARASAPENVTELVRTKTGRAGVVPGADKPEEELGCGDQVERKTLGIDAHAHSNASPRPAGAQRTIQQASVRSPPGPGARH
jgi:hypothetical protein